MACVIVPAAQAVVVSAAAKVASKNPSAFAKNPFVKRLPWLSNLLWGGSVLLVFEHVWHGEIVPFFPFLTAAESSLETAEMLREMATNGTSMALLCTGAWVGMVLISGVIEARSAPAESVKN